MTVAVGQMAPDFTLKSHDGRTVRLSDYRGKRNVVLAFFPLAWTPVWTSQIPSYQAALARFDGVQTQVLGLSVDSTDCLRAWAESLGGITYPLLSDFYPHGQVAERYGVLRSVGSSERAIFVIDKSGVVRYVDVHDVGKQPDNEVLFNVLAEIEPELAEAYQAVEAQQATAGQPVADVPQGNLIMYCTPWCSTCRQARAYLAQNGIAYTEVDISKDRAAAARVRGWANGNETTPTFDINGTIIVDFDQARLRAALGVK